MKNALLRTPFSAVALALGMLAAAPSFAADTKSVAVTAIVEHPARDRRLYYMVTLVSNVLRKNSASVHMEMASRIHRLIESLHAGSATSAKPSPSPR